MKKEEKYVIARFGNFLVLKKNMAGMDFITVRASSGFWHVCYREDSQMYGNILMMVRNKDFHKYLENWITSLYVMAQAMPDLEFYGDFLKAYHSMQGRMMPKDATEEEDKAALEEVRSIYEMEEGLSKGGGCAVENG